MIEGAAVPVPTRSRAMSLPVAISRIARRLREANEWLQEIDDVLAILGQALDCHRTIVFQLKPMPKAGFSQSIASYWVDLAVLKSAERPTLIREAILVDDPLLKRIGEEERQGKVFSGHTRNLEGFLRADFEKNLILSFLSVPIFAHGYLWGTLAINDCVREREWTEDEAAAVELVASAIGDAIEHSSSEQHVSEVFRTTMVQAALDGVVVIDESGGIIEFNPAAEAMFGWSKAELLGKNIAGTLIPQEHRKGHTKGIRRYLEGGPAIMIGRRVETQAINASGESFPIELTISEVRAADRRLFVGSIRDLRERQRAEEEINRQRDRLHQNEKMAAMGSLLAGVSHELNNPLAVVVAQSTLLFEFANDPQVKSRAEKVRAAAERCGRIVKSFLGMVRLHPAQHEETDLNQVIRAALEVTAYGARSTGVTVETDLAPGPLTVFVDADHITQVAANFLVNGQHALTAASGERKIRVRTWRNTDAVGFSVEDTGPGIPAEIAQRIFEPYFTTKPVGVGTGIGLSISRSIVERHNGRIWFDDVEPHGVRFCVELPLAQAHADAARTVAARTTGIARALIIDDEPDVASSLADILEMMGVKASVITRWTSVDDVLAGAMPDIIFSDLRMPEASGMTIYQQFRDRSPSLARRFVIVTGDMLGAKGEIEALPLDLRPLVLEKPFSTLELRGVLALLADRTGQ
ncbi:PAS domain S-box protein [Aquibium sp. LZ166]|uniref:histidine kinase n=1 Tax=Aquibium pacificus TaxID=3153579 RepID=A0ABV3SI01_9HYPH